MRCGATALGAIVPETATPRCFAPRLGRIVQKEPYKKHRPEGLCFFCFCGMLLQLK